MLSTRCSTRVPSTQVIPASCASTLSVYALRKHAASLDECRDGAEDTLFINERFDGQGLTDATFKHCTFANVSFKRATLKGCRFTDCVFEGCYLRETTIDGCSFPASRFIDCIVARPQVRVSDFRYTRFRRTVLPFGELHSNLPSEHNLREELSANLALEAERLGDGRAARLYRLEAIKAYEENLKAGAKWESTYYRTHFPGMERVLAAGRWALSRGNGILWGHGERGRVLLLNLVLVAFVIGPVLLWFFAEDDLTQDGGPLSVSEYLLLSSASVLNQSDATGVDASGWGQALVLGESAFGLLVLGLFVAYVYRWILRR
jgi:hypothetical protein